MFVTPLVNLYVSDVELSLTFYRDRLGFVETFRTPLDGPPVHVEVALDGLTLGLSSVAAAKEVHQVDATPGHPALSIVVWTDDVDAAFESLVASGVPGLRAPEDRGNDNRAALLHDPDGTLVELVAKRR